MRPPRINGWTVQILVLEGLFDPHRLSSEGGMPPPYGLSGMFLFEIWGASR